MEFSKFNKLLQAHVAKMVDGLDTLHVVDLDKDALWNTYLESFPAGTNNIFRTRREFDCSCCRHFVKAFGNVVAIKDGAVVTVWDFQTGDATFQPVVDALAAFVRARPITDFFVTSDLSFGTKRSVDGDLVWDHFYVELPARFKYTGRDTLDTVKGRLRDVRNVFKRSLDTLSEEAVLTVLDLIAQNSLYKGEEWKTVLETFHALQVQYATVVDKEMFCWGTKVGPVVGKIRNHSIGTLLTDLSDLSEGVDLDQALRKYEAVVAPTNYKRPKAVFTKKMLEDAEKTLAEEGLLDSLPRRHAVAEDLTVNNVLFTNRDVARKLSGSVFTDMAETVPVSPKSFDRVETIDIKKFVEDVLPRADRLEVFLENRHVPNLVSLIAPQNREAPSLFKWDNGFSWAYNGNITDSMKERVKAAGGKVDGELRFSIQWNEGGKNNDDFDAHCKGPGGSHIYYGAAYDHASGGRLDVDIRWPFLNPRAVAGVAVENITWPTKSTLREGLYHFAVHNFESRGGTGGFRAELEFDGQILAFDYGDVIRGRDNVDVATLEYTKKGGFRLVSSLPSSVSSKEAWGIATNRFHPVSLCSYSPNFWDGQSGIGHRHYFFMLKGCVNDSSPNGFFNEFVREEYMAHKRVFEALGARMRVAPSADQLSGVGFSSTQPNTLIVKVDGRFTRTLKVQF